MNVSYWDIDCGDSSTAHSEETCGTQEPSNLQPNRELCLMLDGRPFLQPNEAVCFKKANAPAHCELPTRNFHVQKNPQ